MQRERRLSHPECSFVRRSASCVVELEFVLLVGAGQRVRREVDSAHFEACRHLVEPSAFEHAVGIAGMDAEAVETAGLSVSVQWNFVGFRSAELS